ncbi:hypothetical protein [Haloarchaeobius sp. TZWWS8]|uniref:hypothetical protein n=1 Tax=Haloarchaeobius sp. TZWWS8 TaxID=3446121 RepID=UPI003EBF9ACF
MTDYSEATRFRATVEAGVLDAVLDVVAAVADEALFQLREDGLFVRVIGPAEVAMVDLDLPAEAFVEYESDGGVLGFDVATLAEASGLADGREALLSLELDADTHRLDVAGEHFSYAIAPIHPDSIRSVPPVPTVDLPNSVTLDSDLLDRAVSACDRLAHSVHVAVEPADETVSFRAEADVDDLAFTYGADALAAIEASEESETILSLDYASRIVGEMDGEVTLQLGTEQPAFFEHERRGATVRNMLAPRFVRV